MKNLVIAIVCFIIAIFCVVGMSWGATYYVDCAADGDDGAGTSTAANVAWKTIAKVNASSFSGDDQILLKRGCTWREQLTVPSSGSEGSPITFGAYGTGAKPILNGANLVTSWTDNSTGSYDFSFDMEATSDSPWGFTSVTDTGGKLSRSNSAEHAGSYGLRMTGGGGTTQATVNKTGLSYTSTVYASFYVFLSSDIGYNGGHIFEARLDSEWFAGVFLENNNQLFLARNKGSYAKVGSSYTITTGEWHFIEFIATGIGGASGTIEMKVDGTSRASASSIDWSAGYTITNAAWGSIGAWSTGHTAGTIDFDDAWIDADGVGDGVANTWRAAVTTEPQLVMFNGTFGTKVASVAACNGDKKWYWVGNVLYTYGTQDPNTTYPSQIESAIRESGIKIDGKSYITTQDIDIKNTNRDGIHYHAASGGTPSNGIFSRMNLSYIARNGFLLGNWTATNAPNTTTIQNCTINRFAIEQAGTDYCAIRQDKSDGGGDNLTIQNNTITNNEVYTYGTHIGRDGIYVARGDNIVIDSNIITAVGHGIQIWGNADGTGQALTTIVKRNKFLNLADDALYFRAATANDNEIYYNIINGNENALDLNGGGYSIYNNVLYNSDMQAVQFMGYATTVTFKNNIVAYWGLHDAGMTAIYGVDDDANDNIGTSVFDYNLYYRSSVDPANSIGNFVDYGWVTFSQWKTDTSQDAHSLNADPLFVNATTGDFRLLGNSPAKNAGTDVSLTTDYAGFSVPYPPGGAPDIGAYEYRGGGGSLNLLGVGR